MHNYGFFYFQNDDEQEEIMWQEIIIDRVMRSQDAALTTLYIMTSLNMPKQACIHTVHMCYYSLLQ